MGCQTQPLGAGVTVWSGGGGLVGTLEHPPRLSSALFPFALMSVKWWVALDHLPLSSSSHESWSLTQAERLERGQPGTPEDSRLLGSISCLSPPRILTAGQPATPGPGTDEGRDFSEARRGGVRI